MEQHQDIFDQMLKAHPAPVIVGSEIKKFTGGVICGRTLQNLKSRGEKVPDSILIGKRRAYITSSVIEWLRNRTQAQRGQA